MRRPSLSSATVTRLAFLVVIVIVLAQVLWWMIFQEGYIREVSQGTLAGWSRDLAFANDLLAGAPGDAALVERVLANYPHLRFTGGRFELDRAALGAFEARQRGFLRMLQLEGPFFLLVVLLGLGVIWRNLQAERELKRRQDNFLSAVSHEFRTPIGTLKLLVETALYRPLEPAKRRDYLGAMRRELERLEATSEQVLASARLEAGGDPPVMGWADLGAVVEEILARSRAGLEARGARLAFDKPRAPLPVSLDPAAFSVVLSNLLDNAVKYSPQPVKPVRVRLEARDHLVLLHVEDEGVGIKAGERRAIFDKFYRVGSELTRESTGLGLGLHLVKTITEAMNGWVRCEAREGGGSRFTVVLPRRAPLPAEAAGLEAAL